MPEALRDESEIQLDHTWHLNVDESNEDAETAVFDFAQEIQTSLKEECWGIDANSTKRIRYIIDELSKNAIIYGEAKKIEIKIEKFENVLIVKIIDNGNPFDPVEKYKAALEISAEKRIREIGGLGIIGSLGMMENLKYERLGEHNVLSGTLKKSEQKESNGSSE